MSFQEEWYMGKRNIYCYTHEDSVYFTGIELFDPPVLRAILYG